MDGVDIHTGGSVANTGLALKLLGNDVDLMGKVGDDDFTIAVKEGICKVNIFTDIGKAGIFALKILKNQPFMI